VVVLQADRLPRENSNTMEPKSFIAFIFVPFLATRNLNSNVLERPGQFGRTFAGLLWKETRKGAISVWQ
jgi:hypothetical protein